MEEFEGTPLDRVIELTSETVDWEPQLETRFEEQEDAMVGPDQFFLDPDTMDAAHRRVAAFHSFREHYLPEPMFG